MKENGFEIQKEQIIRDSITDVTIDWLTDEIRILPSITDEIRIVQWINAKFPKGKIFQSETDYGELRIVDGRKRAFKIGFNFHRTVLEVYLPQKQWRSIKITTVGGVVEVNDINTILCKCRISSGRARLSGQMEELNLRLVGSNISGDDLDIKQLNISSTSSKVDFTGSISELMSHSTGRGITIRSDIVPERIHSVSTGALVTVFIPDNDGFAFKFKKMSGSFKSDFPLTSDGSQLLYHNGGRIYNAEVRGGLFRLLKGENKGVR